MKIENTSGSYGILSGLLVLLLAMVANAGCMRDVRGRDPGIALESAVTITIVCTDDEGSMLLAYGSGVIVNDHTVLTADHVASTPEELDCTHTATMQNGKEYLLAPGKSLPDRDLASMVLILEKFDPTFPVVYGPAPGFGERVCSMTAFPRWLWRCGEVQIKNEAPGDLVHTIVVEGGNSGSGVYDARGRLVGIITHRWSCSNGQYCGGLMATLEGYADELLDP